jgi:hypothetical protein
MSTQIKMKPILFSSEMVKAIMDGKKTQTRRVLKIKGCYPEGWANFRGLQNTLGYPASEGFIWAGFGNEADPLYYRCPYQVGMKLWVRETWKYADSDEYLYQQIPENVIYKANGSCQFVSRSWRSPYFMSRWASRITLEVTQVRVQQLDEISEEDAQAEGFEADKLAPQLLTAKGRFARAWDSLNAKRGYAWQPGLWVWAITFKLVTW